MKDFVDAFIEDILKKEKPRIKNIMKYMADKVQGDMVGLTYKLLDLYYEGYDPKYYIRTDVYNAQPRDKSGKFTKTDKKEQKRGSDKSLRKAIEQKNSSGRPAIGVSRGNFSQGYIAGVIFDEAYFDDNMQHSTTGDFFDEMDIVSNFLFSADDGYGNHPNMQRSPSAATVLDNYINNYDQRMDRHYKDAKKKIK